MLNASIPSAASVARGQRVGFAVFQTGNLANGGVESITQIIERLQRVRAVVVTQMETPINDRWRRSGAEVLVLPGSYEAWSESRTAIRYVARNNAWMAATVRRLGLGVVHINDIRAFMNLGPGARTAGARLVLNVRDVKPAGEPYSLKWRFAASLSDSIITLSKEMSHDVSSRMCGENLFFGDPTVEHVYSAVDIETMKPASDRERLELRSRFELPPARFVLSYVAAFNEKKAQLAFLERGLSQLIAACPSALVCFVGDFRPERDAYARRCADFVATHSFEKHVRFVGYTDAVKDWYRASDVVLLTSRHEGLARCMIEGLACGTPSISFDVCSAREILDASQCGIVAAKDNYAAIAAAASLLARDQQLRSTMSRNGAALARRLFDPSVGVRRYEEIYGSLTRGLDVG
jgi:glycosyltransferase involved in cell wall biosynthesis